MISHHPLVPLGSFLYFFSPFRFYTYAYFLSTDIFITNQSPINRHSVIFYSLPPITSLSLFTPTPCHLNFCDIFVANRSLYPPYTYANLLSTDIL